MNDKKKEILETDGLEDMLLMDGVDLENKKETKKQEVKVESKLLIKNHSNFTKEGYEKMNLAISKSSLSLIIAALLGLIVIDVFLYVSKSWVFAGVLSGLVVLYPFLMKFVAKKQINRTYNMYKTAFEGSTYDFEFGDDQVNFTYTSQGKSTLGNIKYTSIYQVVEDKDYLFLFISSNQVYIIEKKGFENDDKEELLNHLSSKGVKVKNRKNK